MGQDPTAIRQQIENTRDRMGETVDALSYKTDLPARAKDSINDRVQGARDRILGTRDQLTDSAPGTEDVKQVGQRAVGIAQENPLGLAIGAAAVGFLAGMLIPATAVEDQRLGPVSDQLKIQARQTSHDAVEHGKQIAQDTAEVASKKAQDVAADIGDSVQDVVQDAAQQAKDAASEVKETAQDAAQDHAEDLSSSVRDSADKVQQGAGAARAPGSDG